MASAMRPLLEKTARPMTIEIPLSVLVALFAINGGTLTAFIGAIVFLAVRLGRLPTREEHNELRHEMKADVAQLRHELKADAAQLRQEFREDMARLREEFRRSHQQLLLALGGHSHGDDGLAVFTVPAELDPTPTPGDD